MSVSLPRQMGGGTLYPWQGRWAPGVTQGDWEGTAQMGEPSQGGHRSRLVGFESIPRLKELPQPGGQRSIPPRPNISYMLQGMMGLGEPTRETWTCRGAGLAPVDLPAHRGQGGLCLARLRRGGGGHRMLDLASRGPSSTASPPGAVCSHSSRTGLLSCQQTPAAGMETPRQEDGSQSTPASGRWPRALGAPPPRRMPRRAEQAAERPLRLRSERAACRGLC